MATITYIKLVAFDIGGVLASIDKKVMAKTLSRYQAQENHFFDQEFVSLQAGHINPGHFFLSKAFRLHIPPVELADAFKAMIKVENAHVLPKLKTPFVFASNINQVHFNKVVEILDPSKKHQFSSVLSFKSGLLKPQEEFFAELLKRNSQKKPILFIDDDEKNLSAAKKFGLESAHCPSPEYLEKILKTFSLIQS